MANVIYDKLHDFGTVAATATANFPNNLNLGEASAERMTVDFRCTGLTKGATGSVQITFQVNGSDDGATYVPIVRSGDMENLDELNAGVYQLPIPRTKFKYISATVRITSISSGTMTAGTVQAILNTYVGK
jgi:hypothetical protein